MLVSIAQYQFNPAMVIPVLEEGIKVTKILLDSNQAIDNVNECAKIQQHIYESEILLSALYLKRDRLKT